MFERMDQTWGGIDILVNNAGIDGEHGFGWETKSEAWRTVIEVNLFGAFYCAREALKRMVPQKSGVVVSITSVHEIIAWSGYSAYTASKAGLGMLSKTLAQEAAPHGVRVLAVAPGAIKTPINRAVWSDRAGLKDLLREDSVGAGGRTGRGCPHGGVPRLRCRFVCHWPDGLCGWRHDRLSELRARRVSIAVQVA